MPRHHERPLPSGSPIEDYALLSDLRTAALVGRDGSIDWLCLPRFDAPSCFARILGGEGHWRIHPTAEVHEVRRRYRDTSLVLETEFHTQDGVVRLVDAMPPHDRERESEPSVVRVLEGVSGEVEIRFRWVVRFAYGDAVPWVRRCDDGPGQAILAVAGPHTVVLRGDRLPYRARDERAHEAVFTIAAGQRLSWAMQWSPAHKPMPPALDVERTVSETERFWRDWSRRITYDGPHADAVHRSLTTLKALVYDPSGGVVAAPTTSLPESFGGERNWDYRYCWLRDATFTLLALDNFGCTQEAERWRDWLVRATAGDPASAQIMYGIEGERHLVEWEVDWLPGYGGARPVRVGNAAFRQLQLDVYGEVMDALHLARERGLEESPESWAVQRGMMRHLEHVWQQPDRGLWEVRGPERHFTHSRVMVWVAFDRAVRAVEQHGLPGPVERWRELRETVRAEVLDRGWNDEIGAFTQYYGGTDLDAATLLIPAVGFLPGDDERVLGTLAAIDRELRHGDLVDRYSTHSGRSHVDGLSGREASFLACSFWFVDALALAGRWEEAAAMFGRLVGLANDVGLFAEEYDADQGRFCGNFPQAFSHLALVNSAAVLFGGKKRHERDRANGGK
ncbi:glucoamylase [Streptoalloteichus tenebrarius]|uniref:Glucoamylase n=1 Tax=Streptoalloteichus tenebrarius (strain ATCC 17920 / DSM 40477 / JCM 4838 / CBS 697.72 / NBRC 16177 / NCIMB 11028 / NRRL B-12390 / A12253. 1 / ISP 5477) TaxID=1933 RepID=A0ABT1HV07_STRSD|nr:glycoside hydrolase family 15 protein [Streptoalloteichus tenebrarius]MCP2259349.1 glucoamylase [Streptoalloteichus tenebrarius]BFF02289.1 glycoside hydrolase family 15 protein [Streptoalloteichus tenebrarius]